MRIMSKPRVIFSPEQWAERQRQVQDDEGSSKGTQEDATVVTNWRDPDVRVGDFVVCDDGWVVKILYRWDGSNSTGRPSTIIRTPVGQYTNYTKEFNGEPTEEKHWISNNRENRYKKVSLREMQWVDLVIAGMNEVQAVLKLFKITNYDTAQQKSRELWSRVRVTKYMAEQLKKDIYSELGVDLKYIAKKKIELLEDEGTSVKDKRELLESIQNDIEENKSKAPLHGGLMAARAGFIQLEGPAGILSSEDTKLLDGEEYGEFEEVRDE